MNCEELVRYLSDYIDNNLDEALRTDAEEHLRTCQNCHVLLDSIQKTILIFKELGQEPIPAVRRDALYARLQTTLQQRKKYRSGSPESSSNL